MRLSKLDCIYSAFIVIVSCIFVFDLFFSPGRPASFDATFHITNIGQFYLALKDGNFPVVWEGGFANYGLPIGIIAHQLTSYLGALFTFITNDPTISYNLVVALGVLLSNIFYYAFLRIYFKPHIAFFATVFFNFTAYRIINLYIRGAGPELFSNFFPPLIFIGTYYFIKKQHSWAFFMLCISFFLLSLNHPMMLLIYSFLFLPYCLFLLFVDDGQFSWYKNKSKKIKQFGLFILSLIIGIGMASYYLLPLLSEIKYFYYGLENNHISTNDFLSFSNYFNPIWQYATAVDTFTRGHIIITGFFESVSVILGIGYIVWKVFRRKMKNSFGLVEFAVVVSLLLIFFTTSLSGFLYQHINMLGNIQFPWRMLSAFIFLPPIIYAFFLRNVSRYVILPLIFVVCLLSFPQLYGKNYTVYQKEMYYFNPVNVHSILMNTIWSGNPEDYPIETNKIAIIGGKGKVESQSVHNASRYYVINAKTSLNVVDYTFYFPGWNVYVDRQKVPIQFQDPFYRGIITYAVPQGEHTILVKFEDTKIRFVGKILSLFSFVCFLGMIVIRKRVIKYV